MNDRATFMIPAGLDQSVVPGSGATRVYIKMVANSERIEKRWRAVALWQLGIYTQAEVARRVGVGRDFVRRWARRYERTGGVHDLPRPGRPHILSEADEVEVCRALQAGESSRSVARRLADRGIRVTHQTVVTVAKTRRLRYRVSKPKPAMRRSHKEARVAFALVRRPRRYWDSCMFDDEASFGVYHDSRGRWILEGETAPYRPTAKWAFSVRVWAAVGRKGRTPLFRIPKSMTAVAFAKFMSEKAVPALIDVAGDPRRLWRLVQDGDGTHSARITLQTLRDMGVRVVDPWPSRSPDLNLIENVWSMLGHAMERHHPQTEAGLWRALQAAWKSIPQSKINNCVASMPRRLKAVLKAKGGPTPY